MLNVFPDPLGSRKKVESNFFSVALLMGTEKLVIVVVNVSIGTDEG